MMQVSQWPETGGRKRLRKKQVKKTGQPMNLRKWPKREFQGLKKGQSMNFGIALITE